jgi:hypothetical protein
MTKKIDKTTERINKAIDELASLYEYGSLMAATMPHELLNNAINEIKEYRSGNKPTHKISACYFPDVNEVELTWEHVETGETVHLCKTVSPAEGEQLANVVHPCVYHSAIVKE